MGTLEVDTIRDYLLQVGCKIEYQILVHAFKQYLYNPDPELQGRIRTRFKDYVNQLATVSLENNMKFIILRPQFRPKDQQSVHDRAMQPPPPPPPPLKSIENKQSPPQSASNMQQNQQPSAAVSQQTTVVPRHQSVQRQQQIPQPMLQHQRPIEDLTRQQQQQQSISRQRTKPEPVPFVGKRQQLQQSPQQQQQQYTLHNTPLTPRPSIHQQQPPVQHANDSNNVRDIPDGSATQMLPPPPPPLPQHQHQPTITKRSQQMQRPESLNLSSNTQMPPPRPPPRRRQSTASLFKQSPKPVEKSREIHELAKKSPGRVKEHAFKLNSFTSSSDLNALLPMRSNTMKENRLSRESTLGGSLASALQRNGSHLTNRSRSSHREDESDSSSLQPIDPLRRKWAIEACNCNYNGLLTLLRDDPKLASCKDMVNGYTALHWAAKFGNLDIIKLLAGTHSVSANIKSSAGYTPLHVAYMFGRNEAANLLLKSYKASPEIRDHSGKKPAQYWREPSSISSSSTTTK